MATKTKKLFGKIPKVFKKGKYALKTDKHIDTQIETVNALRHIEYARLRNYNISELLSYELTTVPLYLTKDGFLRKSPKSELTRLIEKKVDIPKVIEIPISTIRNVVTMIDFMAYARKVPVKKANLRTYEDFIKNLWNTFTHIAKNSNRIDIIFDLYLEGSIKQNERDRRKKSTPINVTISSTDQTLPVEMDSFWSSSKNKVELQMCFINWICKSYVDSKPVYLGGSHPEDITKCVKVCDGISEDIRLLKCDHEEADDRIMYHINHADTDIFICLIYHFTRCNFLNLQEIWMLCG